jgi:2-methylcitrate dehydratase PrpD
MAGGDPPVHDDPATPTRDLAIFVAGFADADLPAAIRERTTDILLDAVACALAGHAGDETAQVEPVARARWAAPATARSSAARRCRPSARRC